MPAHYNSAHRVHRLFTRAAQQDPGISALTAWARTFGLDDEASTPRNLRVVRLVGLLYDELELAYAQMQSTSFSKDLYESGFASARAALAIDSLGAQWNNWRQHLRPEVLQALRFCSELLPEQERPVSQDDLADLSKRLHGLWIAVEQSELSEALKAFLFDQITLLETAIREYQVTGARAFRRAFVEGSVAYGENESVVQENGDVEEVRALTGIWKFVASVTDRVEIVQKLLGAGSKLAETGSELAGHIDKIT